MRLLVLILIPVVMYSCGLKNKIPFAEEYAIDSFIVQGVPSLDDYMTFAFENSLATSYSGNNSTYTTYVRYGDTFKVASQRLFAHTGPIFHGYLKDGALTHIINSKNEWIVFEDGREVARAKFDQPLKVLKDDYLITGLPTIPLTLVGDTLLSTVYYYSPAGYEKYFEENSVVESVRSDSSVKIIGSYLKKPSQLSQFFLPFPKYCFHDNVVALIYPCFDTLYCYNRGDKSLTKKVIKNPDYSLPKELDKGKMFSSEFDSYSSQYQLSNFQYKSIRYNPLTGHYLLFYVKPVAGTEEQYPTFRDQPLQLLVVDSAFNHKASYVFRDNYFSPENFSYIPNKGFALPIFKSKFDYGTSKFLVFNF